jgi:hypothetical protein
MNAALRIVCRITACAALAASAQAQWTTQTLELQPGWNAVHLEVEPADNRCDQLLAALPVQSVWGWNRRFSSVQFLQDPDTLLPGQPDWLVWVPEKDPARSRLNLHRLQAGHCYLIHNTGPALVWEIQGRAVVRRPSWLADSLNLVGFAVDPQLPPTFGDFFAGAQTQQGQPIFRLNAAGQWESVPNPGLTPMRRGEAFWIGCRGTSDFAGPMDVTLEQGTALDFGRVLTEQVLRIHNRSDRPRSFLLRRLVSEDAPEAQPGVAGPVALAYFKAGQTPETYGWQPLNAVLETLEVPPGGTWAVRLAVRRTEMVAASAGGLFQSLLEISDDSGARQLIGVTSQGLRNDVGEGAGISTLPPHAGLWVGTAVIRAVNEPANSDPAQQSVPTPAGSEYQFRLIVHVDKNNQTRLLQKVLQMWKPGENKFVLLTDEALASSSNYVGSSTQDGDQAPRRVSASCFGFADPIPMAGEFGVSNSCTIVLGEDDPLNPYKHKYHPDHDNLDENGQPLPPGQGEAFAITRLLQLEFQASDPEGLPLSGWGDTWHGGIYREQILGLHRAPLNIEGIFRLHRISDVAELNDPQP